MSRKNPFLGLGLTSPATSFFRRPFGNLPPNVWARLSSADEDTKNGAVPTLTNNDLTASTSTGGVWHHGRSTLGFRTGQWYWEITPVGEPQIGIENTSEPIDRTFFNAGTTNGIATRNGSVWVGGSQDLTGQTDWTDNDTVGFAFDADIGRMDIYINGAFAYGITTSMGDGQFKKPSYSVFFQSIPWTVTFNFGESGFAQTPPVGYKAVNTANGATLV